MPVQSRDRCYRIASEADRIVEQIAFVLGVATAPNNIAIFVREHRFNAWQRQSLRYIDTADAGMGMRAAENARVEHTGQMDVAGVVGFAGDTLERVHARGGMADGFERVHAVLPSALAPDAASTAST